VSHFEPMGLRIYCTFAVPLLLVLGMVWYEHIKLLVRERRIQRGG